MRDLIMLAQSLASQHHPGWVTGSVEFASLRSARIALRNPPTSSSLAAEERLGSLLLSTAARDPLADARLGILSTPPMEGKDQEEGDH
jgi:hypothetical protein